VHASDATPALGKQHERVLRQSFCAGGSSLNFGLLRQADAAEQVGKARILA
jgi:hypothetical protein